MSQPANQLSEWETFVLRHKHPGNLAMHFVSFLLFFGSPVVALLLRSYWPLVGFFVSGIVGSSGHYLFGDGKVSVREATSSARVVWFNTVMMYKIATRTYRNDVVRAEERNRALGLS